MLALVALGITAQLRTWILQSTLQPQTLTAQIMLALDEYIQRRKQQDILPLFGTIEYGANYDYKKERKKRL